MNVPEVTLGSSLQSFKETTQRLKPAYRGKALTHNEFVRNIHNSFARRMDILNADLALANEVREWKRAKKNPKRANAKNKKQFEEEPGFHFVAFVPLNGAVWKLDGLQRYPVNIGKYGEDWITVARANIYERIGQYDDDGLQFNLLSLCRSPLRSIPEKLAEIIRSTMEVEVSLTNTLPGWKQFVAMDVAGLANKPEEFFGLSSDLIEGVQLSQLARKRIDRAGTDPNMLLELHGDLMKNGEQLRSTYMEEIALVGEENEQAARRKHDFTPMIYTSIKTLAEKNMLKEIMQDVHQTRV